MRLKLGVPFYGPPLGKLAEPSLYAMPRDKAEREWKPPGGPSEAARRMQDAMSVFRADLAAFRRTSAARKASVGGGGSHAAEDASKDAPRL